jgi:dolichol kinase
MRDGRPAQVAVRSRGVTLHLPHSAVEAPAAERERAAPAQRPANGARTVFHVGAGVLALTLLRVMPSRGWLVAAAAAFATFCWTCEILRRRSAEANERLMRFFRPIAHANEWHDVNSATWYSTALLLMSLVMPFEAAEVGVVVLAVADPMAGFVGRRFGKNRLASGRSLQGAAAFAVSGAVASLAWMHCAGTYESSRIFLAVVAGIVGAVVELLVSRVDDNLAIPLGTSLAVALAALA